MNSKIKQFLNYGASFLYGVGSHLVPKRKNYYVFRLFHDPKHFSGNIKALILYTRKAASEIDVVLLSRDREVIREARKRKVPVWVSKIKQFWATLRAAHVIIDSYTGLYRYGNFSVIQLGHGAGYKNLGLLRDEISTSRRRRLRKIYQNYKLVIATSASNLKKKNMSFGVSTGVITGLPRNDIFFENNEKLVNKLKDDHVLKNYKKIVGYAPTFRDYQTVPPFTLTFWEDLQQELESQNTVFLVKKHPWDRLLTVPHQFPNIKEVSESLHAEEMIVLSDWLITDYSSIATDFALTGKPILIYAYDYEAYKNNCRSVYYDLKEVLPKPFLTREDEVLEYIKNPHLLKNNEIRGSYKKFQQEFHQYLDGHSGERVLNAIRRL